MTKKNVSLKDIANSLNLSVDAVSKALRDSDQIGDNTKKLVKQKAKEMGYVKNSSALALKTGKSNNILIYINSLYNQYFSIMSTELIKEIEKNGYTNTICFTNSYFLKMNNLNISEVNRCLAIISLVEPTDEVVDYLKENNISFYLIGIKPHQDYPNYAITDDYDGGYKVGEYFACSSFKKAAYVTNSPSETSFRRRKGFVDAISSLCNKEYKSFPLEENEKNIETLVDTIEENKIDFVFCFSDYLGFIIRTLLHKKYRNYDTVIFGFDNIGKYIETFDPINSVASDVEEISKDVIEHIIASRSNKQVDRFKKTYPVKLILRN